MRQFPCLAARSALRASLTMGLLAVFHGAASAHGQTPTKDFSGFPPIGKTVLDSMGDCSAPRLVETPTEVLCAYSSQHQDQVRKPYLAAFDRIAFLRKR